MIQNSAKRSRRDPHDGGVRQEGATMIELDPTVRVLCFKVDAGRRQNLQRAVEQAVTTLDRLEANGFAVKGLEISGYLLRTNSKTEVLR